MGIEKLVFRESSPVNLKNIHDRGDSDSQRALFAGFIGEDGNKAGLFIWGKSNDGQPIPGLTVPFDSGEVDIKGKKITVTYDVANNCIIPADAPYYKRYKPLLKLLYD